MKVKLNQDLCEANGVCVQEAPEVFKLDDDDVLHVLQTAPAEDLRAKVEAAVRLCPRNALTLEE